MADASPSGAGTGKCIVLADDEESMRKVLARRLESWGFTVIAVPSGIEALEQVAQRKPHVVLLDVMMPGLDGLETCRRLKQDAAMQAIPVILVTAKAAQLTKADI